jgi:hypothetical protein
LDYDVIVELAIERVKNVIRSPRAIGLGIVPVQMVVVDKRPVESDAAMRS